MRVGQARVRRVLAGVGVVVVSVAPSTLWAASDQVPAPATLHVLLTVAPQLSPASRSELMTEATALWKKAGVRLVWLTASDGSIPLASMLRVLVTQKRSVAAAPEPPRKSVLGELVSFGRPGALAIVSIDRAEGLVTAARRPDVVREWRHNDRLGLVLGRVVAHEIGHYLLNTRTHTPSGLMRATFEGAELVDHRSDTFDLDAGTTARLLERVGRGVSLGPAAGAWSESSDPSAAGGAIARAE